MVGDAATRKLAAILHADVVGYSRLMGEDETGTHRALRQYLDAIAGSINKHQGRVVNYSGDAVLADFITVTDALSAAVDVGVTIEGSLVNQLLADAADEPGALPLLQETMGLLWDDMEQRRLPMSAYQRLSSDAGHGAGALSGLAVAIAMKADATLAELDRGQQAIARRIFLRLIQFGGGRADTRRQQPVASLRAANDAEGAFERTLEHLTANRLLTRSGGDGVHPPSVDISHEALIAGWSRLQDWADERREAEQIRRRLESKAAEWVRLGKGGGGLLDEAELPEAERWLASSDAADLGFDATLPELVAASQQAIEEAEQAREASQQRELAQAQALAAEQARAANRMRRAAIGLAAVLLVAVGAAVLAWTQSQKAAILAAQEAEAREQAEAGQIEAEKARRESIAQLLAMQAPEQQSISLDERGALMARQAYLFSASGSRPLQEQMDGVLRQVAGKPYFSTILSPSLTEAIAFTRDGAWLASSQPDAFKVLLRDLTRPGVEPRELPGYPAHLMAPGTSVPAGRLVALAFSPDGKTLIGANADGAIGRWNLHDPQASMVELPRMTSGAWSAAYSPDGRWLAAGGRTDDVFALWDLTRADAEPALIGDPEPAIAGSGPPTNHAGGVPVAFSPDSATLATGSLNGVVRLWRPGDMTQPFASLYGHEGWLLALAFYDDGKRLASSGEDGTIRLWDLSDPSAAPVVINSGASAAVSLDVDAAGDLLASSSMADGIRIRRISKPEQPPIVVASASVFQVKFSPDGHYLASAGTTSFLRLWDLRPTGEPLTLTGHQAPVQSLAFSPDMKLLASGGSGGDGTIRLWRWDDLDADPIVIPAHDGQVNGLDFSHDGRRLLSASWDHDAVRLWDLETLPPSFTALNFPKTDPWTALFSPDGATVAASGNGGVFTLPLGELDAEPDTLVSADNWASAMAYSPQANAVAAAGLFPEIFLKDLNRPDEPSFELRSDSEAGIWSVDFSPDGARLASGGRDGTVRLWHPSAPNAPSVLLGRHDASVRRVLFSPDGRLLASGGEDHSVRLWNMENLEALPIVLPGHDGDVRSLAFSAN